MRPVEGERAAVYCRACGRKWSRRPDGGDWVCEPGCGERQPSPTSRNPVAPAVAPSIEESPALATADVLPWYRTNIGVVAIALGIAALILIVWVGKSLGERQRECEEAGGAWNDTTCQYPSAPAPNPGFVNPPPYSERVEVSPAPSAEEVACTANGGSWIGSGCIGATSQEEAACDAAGGDWNGYSCHDTYAEQALEEQCQQANGVWSSTTGTCYGEDF